MTSRILPAKPKWRSTLRRLSLRCASALAFSRSQPSTGPAHTASSVPLFWTAPRTHFSTCEMHVTNAGPYDVELLKNDSSDELTSAWVRLCAALADVLRSGVE